MQTNSISTEDNLICAEDLFWRHKRSNRNQKMFSILHFTGNDFKLISFDKIYWRSRYVFQHKWLILKVYQNGLNILRKYAKNPTLSIGENIKFLTILGPSHFSFVCKRKYRWRWVWTTGHGFMALDVTHTNKKWWCLIEIERWTPPLQRKWSRFIAVIKTIFTL